MTGLELENFYKYDEGKYILNNNQEFLDYYQRRINEGFQCELTIEQFQNIIDEIVLFFEFKYHDNMLRDSLYGYDKDESYHQSKKIAQELDIEQLKYRLYHDYVYFLECLYPHNFTLRKEKENSFNLRSIYLKIDEFGNINKYDLEDLIKYHYLDNIKGINDVKDLLVRFMTNDTKVDYSELKQLVYNNETKLVLRRKILELIPLAMIYSKNTLPEYGYIRAKSFIKMFNKGYDLNLDTKEIDTIMNKNYKKENNEINKPKFKILQRKNNN